MIPPTTNGLPALACVSAMQKCIRRGMERKAMEFAVELIHGSKAQFTMVCNRLEIISHEDIGLAAPNVVVLVATCVEQAKRHYKADRKGPVRMILGNAIRAMCRALKSREGDYFQAAVGLEAELNGFVPTIPDFALDMHTQRGRQMGRGIDHFLEEGTVLVPEAGADMYQGDAERLWRQKHKGIAE